MARLRHEESVDRDEHSTIFAVPSSRSHSHAPLSDASPSPSPPESSDKENQRRRQKSTSMAPPPRPAPQSRSAGAQPNKRRRTGSGPMDSHDEPMARVDQERDSEPVYDPNQDVRERQNIRKGLRDLERDVHDLGPSEWMKAESSGLHEAIKAQNRLYRQVKQTSDATIDSRFLVKAAGLASKKTKNAALGDGSNGLDIDDFISKCIVFMRKGDEAETAAGLPNMQGSNTQRARRMQMDADEDEDDSANNGDAHNWAWLGARACYPSIKRPSVPGFLLGPLSVQKRVRAVTQRRARQQRVNPELAIKPTEIDAAQFGEQENTGVTQMCKGIHARLWELYNEAGAADEAGDDDTIDAVIEKNGILDNGGISLFRFTINPHSFGQTVENIFYVSFLVKEGLAGIEFDSDGMPALMPLEGGDDAQQSGSHGTKRYQAVIGIDFDDWKALIDTFNIREPLIKHRLEEAASNGVGASGWYGS